MLTFLCLIYWYFSYICSMEKKDYIISILSFSIVFCLYFIVNDSSDEAVTEVIIMNCSDTLSEENLAKEIVRAKIKQPEIVFRQAMWETGNLECVNCSMDRNNLFGFRDDKGYLDFVTWQSSVYYYSRWQKKYKKGNYYHFLEKIGYAEDSSYTAKLQSVIIPDNIKIILNENRINP
jgi:hypothetical protein